MEDQHTISVENKYLSVTKEEVLDIFKDSNNFLLKSKNGINLKPNLSVLRQEKIFNTSEYITIIPATTIHQHIQTNIVLVKYQDSILRVLVNLIPDSVKTEKFSGILSITDIAGKFINGYRVKNGIFISQFIKHKKLEDNIVLKENEIAGDCDESLDPDSRYCDQYLDEVTLGGSNSTSTPPLTALSYTFSYLDGVTYVIPTNSGGGGSSAGTGSITQPVFPCDDPIHGCDNNYDCPEGQIVNRNGECVEKPCLGDLIKDPTIAPQKNSGIQGGMYGWTRSGGKKFHGGLDIKNLFGEPIFAMYDGIATVRTQTDKKGKVIGAGYYVNVATKINNKAVIISYFHLQNENRASGNIKAGDIIGYQGDSGNLKAAIEQGLSVSHVHIQVKVDGINVAPYDFINTKFNTNDGTVISQNNCKQ